MASTRQIVAMVTGHGFTERTEPGFLAFTRAHPTDGRSQQLHVFTWSNKKIAAAEGTPSAYLVICPAIDVPLGRHGRRVEDERFKIPLVEWPDAPDTRRPWASVLAEFDDLFAPVFDLPAPEARIHLDDLRESHPL